MSSIVYIERGGKKYAYRSTSFWDTEKKAPRSRMEYLGRVDENGEIIPKKEATEKKKTASQEEKLRSENRELKKRIALLERTLSDVLNQEIRQCEVNRDRIDQLTALRDSVLKQ